MEALVELEAVSGLPGQMGSLGPWGFSIEFFVGAKNELFVSAMVYKYITIFANYLYIEILVSSFNLTLQHGGVEISDGNIYIYLEI